MAFVCPYCNEEFEKNEVLFYVATERKFIIPANGDKSGESYNATATGGSQEHVHVTDFGKMRNTRHNSLRSSAQAPIETQEEPAAETKENTPIQEIPYGEQIEDSKIKQFLKSYGEGTFFTFKRTARFYAIRKMEEINPEDPKSKGYGYIENENQLADNVIPNTLIVPSRPRGSQSVTHPICPHCHCDLPVSYFQVSKENRHNVALAGCTAAGKTQFITVALADLQRRFAQMGLGQQASLTECSMWFHEMFLNEFQGAYGIEATKTEYMLFPMMLQVTAKDGTESFITFHDCAGEYADNSDYATNQQGFRLADTLMLMVDAAQMFGQALSDGERKADGDYKKALLPMRNYRSMVQSLQHVLVLLTKSDTIIGSNKKITETVPFTTIKMGSYVSDLTCHEKKLNLTTISTNSQQLIQVMHDSGYVDFVENVLTDLNKNKDKDQLKELMVFAVSTYSRNVVKNTFEKVNTVDGALFHRLIEPLLYAMYNWGIVEGAWEERIIDPPPPDCWLKRLFKKRS